MPHAVNTQEASAKATFVSNLQQVLATNTDPGMKHWGERASDFDGSDVYLSTWEHGTHSM